MMIDDYRNFPVPYIPSWGYYLPEYSPVRKEPYRRSLAYELESWWLLRALAAQNVPGAASSLTGLAVRLRRLNEARGFPIDDLEDER